MNEISSAGKGQPQRRSLHAVFAGSALSHQPPIDGGYCLAIGYLRRAVEIDPDFAQAWAVLSSALTMAVDFAVIGVESTEESSVPRNARWN